MGSQGLKQYGAVVHRILVQSGDKYEKQVKNKVSPRIESAVINIRRTSFRPYQQTGAIISTGEAMGIQALTATANASSNAMDCK